MRQRGIVADLLRKPQSVINQQIETLLVLGDANLRAGDYTATDTDIRAANVLLDLYQYWGKWVKNTGSPEHISGLPVFAWLK